jgi:hypothetical protein
MKKITLLAVAFVAISLASCKKDRDCECTTTTVFANGTTTTGTAQTITIKEIKKSEAKTWCTKKVTVETDNTGTETKTSDCKLK